MIKHLYTIVLILIAFNLFAEEGALQIRLNEKELAQFANGKFIEIRGFIFEDRKGLKILSNEPNLRTCCAGAKNKRKTQILIVGDIGKPTTSHAIKIQGRLYENNNSKGPLYRLEEPKILVLQDPNIIILWTVLVVLILGLFIYSILRRKK